MYTKNSLLIIILILFFLMAQADMLTYLTELQKMRDYVSILQKSTQWPI
jgi:hypothetical protein